MPSAPTNTRAHGVEPFFFGSEAARLYGFYDPPRGVARRTGVVLCYPTGHEYAPSHRAMRLLAQRLAEVGFPVLRFDYFGTGDSAGEVGDWRLGRFESDVATAIEELLGRADRARVALVGLGVGASLAASASAGRNDVEALALWDPVVNGRAYLEELTRQHEELFSQPDVVDEEGGRELLGFLLPPEFVSDLEALDLSSLASVPSSNVLLIESDSGRGGETLAASLRARNARVEYVLSQSSGPKVEHLDSVSVPIRVLDVIQSWLTRVAL